MSRPLPTADATGIPGHDRIDVVARPRLRVAARCSCRWTGPDRDRLVSARDDAAGHLLDADS